METLTDRPDQRAVFRRAAPFLRGHRIALAAVVALNLGGALLAIGVTAVVGRVIDAAGSGDRDALLRWAAGLLLLVACGAAVLRSSRYRLIATAERVLAALREHATGLVAAAPLRFVERHRGGELQRRLTGEIDGLAGFVGKTLPDLVTTTLMLGCTAVMLALHSWPLTAALTVVFVPVAGLIVGTFRRRSGPAFVEMAAAQATVAATFAESLPAREQLRMSGAVPRWLDRFRRENDRLVAAHIGQVRAELVLNRLGLLQAGCLAGVLVLGAALVGGGALSVGTAVVFVLATRDVFTRFEDLAGAIGEAREAHVRLARVLDLVRAARPPETSPAELPPAGAVELRGVTFSYTGDRPVVDDLSLTVEPGEHLVIVGETGSGKSTLGKLIAGLYAPGRGVVAYAGHDLARVDPDAVRRRIMLVPQEVLLVDGTLADNLTPPGVPGAPPPDVPGTLAALGLEEWIASLPHGLDTRVGPHGAHLSAGERQLVAIARAVAAGPAVLVLDEATADVDTATAARIEAALAAAFPAAGDRTLIVIAHRAATIAAGARRGRLLRMPEGITAPRAPSSGPG